MTDYYDRLDKYTHVAYTEQVKRAVSMVSPFYKPVLADMDVYGRPVNSSKGLGLESQVAYFEDVKGDVDMFFDGSVKKQDRYDGAFIMHPLEVLKTIHSYGGSLSGLNSNILKDITSSFDKQTGVLNFEKKASFMLTLEWMINGNGPINMMALNKAMLSTIPFKPVIEYKGENFNVAGRFDTKQDLLDHIVSNNSLTEQQALDALAEVEQAMNNTTMQFKDDGKILSVVRYNGKAAALENMFDVFNLLGGESNSDIWEEMLDVENQNKDIAYQYIGKIGFTTSVKTGVRKVNDPIDKVLASGKPLKYISSSNEGTGLQQNPKHDPSDLEDALSTVTQKLSALALEGKMTKQVDAIFEAIALLSDHNTQKLMQTMGSDARNWIVGQLKSSMEHDDNSLERLNVPNWSVQDRDIYRTVFTKVMTTFEKVAVKHKFRGGQFVVTPVSDIIKEMDYVLSDRPNNR
jgi:hypothetical protein